MTYMYPFNYADERVKRAVWNKGAPIPGYEPNLWRRDITGHAVKYTEHGNQGDYGWEIDHIRPISRGGSDDIGNLQPLWWQNNRTKGDIYPWAA